MNEVVFEGKTYKDIDRDAQIAFSAMDMYTFRYHPKDKLWMASDSTAKKFGINKFYKIEKEDDGPNLVYEADREKDRNQYTELVTDTSKERVSGMFRFGEGDSYYKITLAVIERDEDRTPSIIGGMVENVDDDVIKGVYMTMLSDDYFTVIDVNLDNNKKIGLRVHDYIDGNYGTVINDNTPYEKAIRRYIDREVIEEERADMYKVTSLKNLEKKLKNSNVYRHDYRVLRDGEPHFIRMKVVKINEGEGLHRIVLGFAEVSHDAQSRLERLAYYDQVTLGNNYNYFAERLKEEKSEGFIVSIDVKDFRLVNEACGINMGDTVLREVDKLIGKSISRKGFFAHVNGDHFVAFLPLKKEEAVVNTIQRITAGFDNIIKKHSTPNISPYFGVTTWKPGDRIQIMFSQANFAKHRIKDSSEINYGFYRDEDNARAIAQKKIEESFETAIKQKQFEVWYQPKYSPIARELTGAEALVRWRNQDGDLVSPGVFIPIFERNGMIRRLDEYVYTNVCQQQRKWIDEIGCTVPVSVNLSRASLFYENIVEEYKAIADEYGILPELVPIEITESAAISNSDIKILADKFYAAGFPLQIDDFGTGYSSLATLNLMRFDTLKLDKSLIDYIGEFGGERLIKHTVALAKDMGLHVTAEGVEKNEQVVFLKDIDCDNIQGFFYSRPVPLPEFECRLTEDVLSDKYLYRKGDAYTFENIVDAVRRVFSSAAVQKADSSYAVQINLRGNTEGSMYIKFDCGKASVEPYEYRDNDACITLDATTLVSVLKGIGTMENAIRTGRVKHEGSWDAIIALDRITRK